MIIMKAEKKTIMIENLDIKEWLSLNAKLQAKKSDLRKALKAKGVLKKGAVNEYDKYKYFSEAQYKELFTELLTDARLELKFTEVAYDTFEGTEKQANGRMPKLQFTLFDVETGFYENTLITGEGIDKGDKAGYKAYTGALKYYLANTFMVATGDDPEKDSPASKMNTRKNSTAALIKNINALRDQLAQLGYDVRANDTMKAFVTQKAGVMSVDPADLINDAEALTRLYNVLSGVLSAKQKELNINSTAETF